MNTFDPHTQHYELRPNWGLIAALILNFVMWAAIIWCVWLVINLIREWPGAI